MISALLLGIRSMLLLYCRPGTGRQRVSTAEQDANLVALSEGNPFRHSSWLVANSHFPGCSKTARNRLGEANLHARRAAIKEVLTDAHCVDHMAYAATHADADWSRVVFSDEKTFSSSNDGPQIVYRPNNSRFDPKYVHQRQKSGRFSVCAWGWMSAAGGGPLWLVDGHLTGEQYRDILRDVMVPSVRVLYPDGPISFQQVSILLRVKATRFEMVK